MVTHGKNNQVTMISLSFSGVGCLFESEIWCIEDLSGHCWALIMEPCGVNCFLLEISQPVADVSAGYKWESPKSGFICPGGTASITQNVSQFPYHLFQKWSKKDATSLSNELRLTGNTKVITIFMHSIGQPAGSDWIFFVMWNSLAIEICASSWWGMTNNIKLPQISLYARTLNTVFMHRPNLSSGSDIKACVD